MGQFVCTACGKHNGKESGEYERRLALGAEGNYILDPSYFIECGFNHMVGLKT